MKGISVILAAVMCVLILSGCDLWMNGQYYVATPHQSSSSGSGNTDAEVTSYLELRNKLTQLVSQGTENAVIYYPSVEENVLTDHMESAIAFVTTFTPVGAYAVSDITYEYGTNTAKQAVAVTVTYSHGRSEILRIRHAQSMEEACVLIEGALKNCDAGITVQVTDYRELDVQQFVQDYVDGNPDVCMEMPQVTATVYPEKGAARVLEVLFSYQTSRDDLRGMQQTVAPIFNSAELYVSGDGEASEKYLQLYAFLMERHDYQIETAITPAYHLLRHGVGDCKAFATVYAVMCRRAGLYCQVVSGTREGESWYWNVISDGSDLYYVDLLACSEQGRYDARLQEDMQGYVWDYDQFQMEPEETVPETT